MDSETLHLESVYFSAFCFIKTETSWIFVKTQFFSFYFIYFSLSKYVTTFYIRGIRDGWPFSEMGSLLFIFEFVDHMPFICSNSATYFVILE